MIKGLLPSGIAVEVHFKNGLISEINKIEKKGDLNQIMPGFIDVHTHGGHKFDWNFANIEKASNHLYRQAKENGVTSILGTMITEVKEIVTRAIRAQAPLLKESPGANLIGYHLEGPYISIGKRGAHLEELIHPITKDEIEYYFDPKWVPSGAWKTWTIAPEENNVEFTKELTKRGVVVSAGHTLVKPTEIKEHIEAGLKSVTHFNNAMPKLNSDDPEYARYMLENKDIYKELILDGVHVDQVTVDMIMKDIQMDRLMLITDSLKVMGLPNGQYRNQVGNMNMKNGVAYQDDGTLNGSAITYINMFKNARVMLPNITNEELAIITSGNQAEMLKLNKGKIEIGYDADIILLDKNDNLLETYVSGKLIK